MGKNFSITLLYDMASIVVVGLIRVQIPNSGNGLGGKKVFKKEKLSEVCDIACVSVLQRGCFKALARKEIGSNRLFPK